MQIAEIKKGVFRRRFLIACTLVAADVDALETELAAAAEPLKEAMEFHRGSIAGIKLVIASGNRSSRAHRPAIRQRLQEDPFLRELAKTTTIKASFLNRMGDAGEKFRIGR